MAQAYLGNSNTGLRSLMGVFPDLMRPTDKLPFNGPCSGVRGHCWTGMPFSEARAIRSALGGTINDAALTIVVGAVSKYVTAHREPLKDRYVRFLMPVNLRTDDRQDTVGNNISMLPISIPLDVEDPAERMRVVTLRSSAMKVARIADAVALIGTSLGWIPPGFQQPIAALPFMPQSQPFLIVNMVCTNVPGPMVPLYCKGHEVLTYYPHVPCGSDTGISVAISSYNQSLNFGVTYDAQAAPDGELFRDFLIESREELRAAAGIVSVPAHAVKPLPTAKQEGVFDPRAHRKVRSPAVPVPSRPHKSRKTTVDQPLRKKKTKVTSGSS
jgi:diacylglycerol O-acyltransferase